MRHYNEKATCEKCGGAEMRDNFKAKGEHQFGDRAERQGSSISKRDSIERTCQRCHFAWEELPIEVSPSPAHGGTSAIRVAADCLDSVLSAAECDCIPNEFQCVKHGAMDELSTLRARLAALTRERDDLRCMVTRLLAVIQQYGGARGSSFSELIANARAVATGCEIDTNGRCSLERLRRSNRERDDARDEVLAERARAEKARGDAVARVPSVDEMMHAFDEKQGKLDDPFRRNLWLAELAAVRDLVLRALAHDEGRGTPERKEP